MSLENKELLDMTPVDKQNASVIVGSDETLLLRACIKPYTDDYWGIEVYGEEGNNSIRRVDGWYNLMFESGLDFDQAVVIDFFLHEDFKEEWTFYGKGIEFFKAGCNCQYTMYVNLYDCRKAGQIILNNIEPTYGFELVKPREKPQKVKISDDPFFLPVGLSFLAEYDHCDEDKRGVYLSQDPLIGIGKTKHG